MKKDSRMVKMVMIFLIGISISLAGQHVYAGPSNNVVIIGGDHLDTGNGWDTKAANVMCVGSGGCLPVTGTADELGDFNFSAMRQADISTNSLKPYDTAVLNMASYEIGCSGSLSSSQRSALTKFLAEGNKLIIYDTQCGYPIDYSWVPYPFTSAKPSLSNTGLAIVENNGLSSSDPTDYSYIDVDELCFNTDAENKMRVMITSNLHWYVDMVGTNYSGANGVVHAYATYPEGSDAGLIIYNGLSLNDLRNNDPNLRKIWVQELQQPFNYSSLPGSVPISGINLEQKSASCLVGGTHTVTATITDLLGNPKEGVSVYFLITGINASVSGTYIPTTRKTGNDGKLSFTYTDTHGGGIDNIKARFTNASGQSVYSNTLNVEWTLIVLEINLEPKSTSGPVGVSEDHTVTATVTDQSDDSPQPGIPVDFLITSGPNRGTDNAFGTCTPADCKTGNNGQVSFNYLDEGGEGIDEIEACFITPGSTNKNCSDVVTHEWTNIVEIILAQAGSSSKLNQNHTVTATLKNQMGTPQVGIPVTISITGANAGATGTYSTSDHKTDTNGQVKFTYLGTKEGIDHIKACFNDTSGSTKCSQVNMEWTLSGGGGTTSGFLQPDNGLSLLGGNHTVTATLTDLLNAPKPGVEVTFSITGSNASAIGTYSTSDHKTDTNGQVKFTYIGTHLGKDKVEGCFHNESGNEICSEVNTEWIEFTVIKLNPEISSNSAGGTHTVTATLTDLLSVPKPGITVQFSITSGPNSGVSGHDDTDGYGHASFTYLSGGTTGTDVIQAHFSDGSCSGVSQVENEWVPNAIPDAHVTLEGTVSINDFYQCQYARVTSSSPYFVGPILTNSSGHYSWTNTSVPPCSSCEVRGIVTAQWDIQDYDGNPVRFEGSTPFSFENPSRFLSLPHPPVDINVSRVW